MHATSWGAFPLLGYFLVRYLCEGMGHTKPAMYMALAALVLKWPLNYAFMYGHWGVPKLGGVGCGWASAILWWAEFFGMLLVTRMPFVRVTGLFAKFSWPKWSVLQRFLVIGLPIGATGVRGGIRVFADGPVDRSLRSGDARVAPDRRQPERHDVHGAAGARHGDDHTRRFQRRRQRLRSGAAVGDGRAARGGVVRVGRRTLLLLWDDSSWSRCSAPTRR